MYKKKIKLNISHTDVSGAIFHGRIFELTDMVYEDFLEDSGILLSTSFKENLIALPVVNCNANFYSFVTVGDKLEVSVSITKVGNTSFELLYDFKDNKEKTVMDAHITVVSINKSNRKPIKIPDQLLKLIEAHRH